MTGDVCFDVPIFEAVSIVGEPIRQQTEDANARTGGANLNVDGLKPVYDLLCPGQQFFVHDAAIQVYPYYPATNPDVDAVIALCRNRSLNGRECRWGVKTGFACTPCVYGTFVCLPFRSSYFWFQN